MEERVRPEALPLFLLLLFLRSTSLGSDSPGMTLAPIMESRRLLRSPFDEVECCRFLFEDDGEGGRGMSCVRIEGGWFTSMMLEDRLCPSSCSSGSSSSMWSSAEGLGTS